MTNGQYYGQLEKLMYNVAPSAAADLREIKVELKISNHMEMLKNLRESGAITGEQYKEGLKKLSTATRMFEFDEYGNIKF